MPKINTIFTRTVTSNSITDIHISGDITDPLNYLEEMQFLREAIPGDTINVYINSGGGRVDTAVQFINCMRNSAAKVIAHIEGQCHSAATYIFLTADEWVVNQNCIMLVHNYSGGAGGKGGDIVQNADANHKWITKLMHDVYKAFLTPEEIEEVCRNQDIWLNSEEVLERLEQVIDYREGLAKDMDTRSREEIMKQIADLIPSEEEEGDKIDESDEVEIKPDEEFVYE